jgi:hypothetical protein
MCPTHRTTGRHGVKNETPINLPETFVGRIYFVLIAMFVIFLVAGTIFTSPGLYAGAFIWAILGVLFAIGHWISNGRD